jgi:hypothetical protein
MRFSNHHQHSSHSFSSVGNEPLNLSKLHNHPSLLLRLLSCLNPHFKFRFHRSRFITMQSNMFSSSKLAILAAFALQFSAISLAHPTLEERSPPIVMGLAAGFGAIAHTTLTSTGATV